MNNLLSKVTQKLFFKQWVIGICRDNIEGILKSRIFDGETKWLVTKSLKKFYADPFLIPSKKEEIKILFEEYVFKEQYGKIALLTLNKNFAKINCKTLLDTKSHLSYPFVFTENNKHYIFPEAAKSGKLSCYEYDEINENIIFIKDILHVPLLDSTILKYDDQYWIFGTLGSQSSTYTLNVFFSNSLFGPYTAHDSNPIKKGLDAIRPAGNFIKINGEIFRPTQNCRNKYGESITLNRLKILNEKEVTEEVHMKIEINSLKKNSRNIHSIHTFNVLNDIIVIDGQHWTFSPFNQLKKFLTDKFK